MWDGEFLCAVVPDPAALCFSAGSSCIWDSGRDVSWPCGNLEFLPFLPQVPFCTHRPLKAEVSRPSLGHRGGHLHKVGTQAWQDQGPHTAFFRQAVGERAAFRKMALPGLPEAVPTEVQVASLVPW